MAGGTHKVRKFNTDRRLRCLLRYIYTLRPGRRHCFGPVFDSPHRTQQGQPGLGQLEPGFEYIDELTALPDPGALLVLGQGCRATRAASQAKLGGDGIELILG